MSQKGYCLRTRIIFSLKQIRRLFLTNFLSGFANMTSSTSYQLAILEKPDASHRHLQSSRQS